MSLQKTQSPDISVQSRVADFCARYGLRLPVLMAPMAGACPPALGAAVANAGDMGACGALLMSPDQISDWAKAFRAGSNGTFCLNTWIPDPTPRRDAEHEAAIKAFLADWGPPVPDGEADASLLDFDRQCEAMLAASPSVMSSIMGLYPPHVVAQMKSRGIAWFATVTTVAEARAAVDAGADVVIAQGMEAGGHRGAFDAEAAVRDLVGLFSLVPAIVDAVDVPVVAAGGIAEGRGIAAALTLGASAVCIGTGLLRTPEAAISTAWADAIGAADPSDTTPTRAFSGRLGRAIASPYVVAANSDAAPPPAPYPVQRSLTAAMRREATAQNDIRAMQAWAGQSSKLAQAMPATELVQSIWADAQRLLPTAHA